MNLPALTNDIGLVGKRELRHGLDNVLNMAARKAGFNTKEEHLAHVVANSTDKQLEVWKLRVKLEPKELSISRDNSAEALLEAIEAMERGEKVTFLDEANAIEASYTEVAPIPHSSLWSPRVMAHV